MERHDVVYFGVCTIRPNTHIETSCCSAMSIGGGRRQGNEGALDVAGILSYIFARKYIGESE